jgi:hypothetical protein
MVPLPPPFDLQVPAPGFASEQAQTKFRNDVQSISAICRCEIGDESITFSIGSGFTKHSAVKLAALFRGYKLEGKPLLDLFGKRFGWRRDWPELSAHLRSILESC